MRQTKQYFHIYRFIPQEPRAHSFISSNKISW